MPPTNLDALRALDINPLRRALLQRAPSYATIRFQRIAIRRAARSTPLRELPMPAPLRKAVTASGRSNLGDLHGLTYAEVLGRPLARNQAMRQLHGLLRILRAAEPERKPLFAVPGRVRSVALRHVPMPRHLRRALDAMGLRTVGQLASLTAERLQGDFDGTMWNALQVLVARVQSLTTRSTAFARAIDAAIARLPPSRRRALELRFGASGRPIVIRTIARRCGLRVTDPHRVLDRWTQALADDGGPAVARAHEELRAFARRRGSVLSSDEVDALLQITASRPRRKRDFYLRLLRRIRPRVKFEVTWGKRVRR